MSTMPAAAGTEPMLRVEAAHTYYGLLIGSPSLEIADPPTFDASHNPLTGVFVGLNTLLGTTTFKS